MTLMEFLKMVLLDIDNQPTYREAWPYNSKAWQLTFHTMANGSGVRGLLGMPAFFNDLQWDWDSPLPVCQELRVALGILLAHFSMPLSMDARKEWRVRWHKMSPEQRGFVVRTSRRLVETEEEVCR